jgi:hypothetical protein
MSSILKVDEIQDTSGNNIINENANTVTIGKAGDTVNVVGTLQNSGTNFAQGITMADQWRITANVTINGSTQFTTNWEQNDTTGAGQIGTGMTESSGTFTFPETGIYFIQFETSAKASGGVRGYIGSLIYITTDNSSYDAVSYSYQAAYADTAFGSPMASFIFDVTDTSTHKIRFYAQTPGDVIYEGSTSDDKTKVRFIRLGDT